MSGRLTIGSALLIAAASAAFAQTPPVTRAPTASAPATVHTPPSPASIAPAPSAVQRQKLPDLTFASVNVNNVNHEVSVRMTTPLIVVDHVFPPQSTSGARQPAGSPCNRSFTFPVVLSIRNIGTADFVPLSSAQAVGLDIGTFNAAKDLIKLTPNQAQTMSWSVTLPPGNYTLSAFIDTHGQVAESNVNNNKLSWPLKVSCEVRSSAATAPAPIKKP